MVREKASPFRRSLVAEIMDWADDITFAIHDLLDFYCAGKIPIDRCKGVHSAERERLIDDIFQRKAKWTNDGSKYIEALAAIVDAFPFEPDARCTDSPQDRAALFNFSTGLIGYFVDSIRIRKPNPKSNSSLSTIQIDEEARREVEVLKQFTWEYVIENPDLAVPQQGQRAAIRTVFGRLMQAWQEKHWYVFPPAYQTLLSFETTGGDRARIVADCISGMTEKELMHFYRSVEGLA
jgi:dGTPase